MAKQKKTSPNLIALNRKVRHDYELLEFLEAGLSLTGPEVKSLRAGHVSFGDGYVAFSEGQAWLRGVRIAPYENAGYVDQDPDRDRRLLLHAHEIVQLARKVEQKGLTVVPVKLYFSRGKVKLEIAVARGKNVRDMRETLKRRAADRDMAREMAGR
ncbi:MAG: SsrA-binding protein SmpB [Desulfovibrionaceae bacterium]|jgi:SsrA-binding protein|nr:SsrA-binding protein SmpB [Desulfovibrionaceae bacterium]